jgi:Protein of unknown function (DUF4245)
MSETGPSGDHLPQLPAEAGAGAVGTVPAPPPDRMGRLTALNMTRSLVPLLVIILLIAGWNAFRQSGDANPVHPVDPSGTVRTAAAKAAYHLLVPTGLPSGYQPTSARTDAGGARQGAPVTLQIGYLTPSRQYVGFVESDDAQADALTSVSAGAEERGTVQLGGTVWTRSTTQRGEPALTLRSGSLTVVVTGSASEKELETVAGAVRPYSG